MKKIIRLTESDLVELIKRVINEQDPGLEMNPTNQSQPSSGNTSVSKTTTKPKTQVKPKPKTSLQNQYDFWEYDNDYIHTGKQTHAGLVLKKDSITTKKTSNPEILYVYGKNLSNEQTIMYYDCGNSFLTALSGRNKNKRIWNEELIDNLKQSVCPQG